MCANAPLAVAAVLDVANAEIRGEESDSWARSEAANEGLLMSEDVREGIDAFFARRSPRWKAR